VKRRALLLALTGLLLLVAAPARAEIAFAPCGQGEIECATVPVPVDRGGEVAGTIDLAVYRARARGAARGVLLGLPGGPGDGGLAYFKRRLYAVEEARATHDLVFVDPRGAGASRPLQCSDAASCARELGAASRFFTSRDVAEDVEAVRAALGIERIALYGISYGGWYAQTYARLHPDRVSALALDSTVTRPIVDDPFERFIYAGLPSAARALCPRGGGCAGRDPYADAAVVLRRLRGGTLVELVEAALATDVNPAARAELPAALAARRRGDRAPLARLVEGARLAAPPDRTRDNPGTNVVTQCEERAMPWERTEPFETRLREAQRRLSEIPASAFAPLDPTFALLTGVIPPCLEWPAAPESPLVGGDLPPVPTLVLAGGADIRVPAATGRDLAASLPSARLLLVRDVGHGVLGEEPTGCARRALADVLVEGATAGGGVEGGGAADRGCEAAGLLPRPPFARRLRDVPPRATLRREATVSQHPRATLRREATAAQHLRATRRGAAVAAFRPRTARRAITAAALTATDALNQAAMRIDALRRTATSVRFRGLRGGSVLGDEDRVVLHRARFVRDLRVSGVARADGRHDLAFRGAARGRLRIRGARFSGVVDGVRVRGTLDLRAAGGAGVPVSAML
jgi:pimeloyl-ACP methyl ester carboxylesterase